MFKYSNSQILNSTLFFPSISMGNLNSTSVECLSQFFSIKSKVHLKCESGTLSPIALIGIL
jgi:hypothetical protein